MRWVAGIELHDRAPPIGRPVGEDEVVNGMAQSRVTRSIKMPPIYWTMDDVLLPGGPHGWAQVEEASANGNGRFP
jgi:hypothetical protein